MMTTSGVPLPVCSENAVPRRGRRLSVGAMAMALMLGLSGCGGGSSSSDPVDAPPVGGPVPGPAPVPGPSPTPSPTPPIAKNSCLEYPLQTGNASGTLAGKANSPAGRSLIFSKLTEPRDGTVQMDANGVFTYTRKSTSPSRGDVDSFDYRVTDSTGLTAQATAQVIYGSRRIMPLGDSITEGVESNKPTLLPLEGQRVGYRQALYTRLVAEGYPVDFVGSLKQGAAAGLVDQDHEGHGAFTQSEVAAGVTDWLNQNPADVVLLHIGTNDVPGQADPTSTLLGNINSWASNPVNPPVQLLLAQIISRRTVEGTRDQAVDAFNDDLAQIYQNSWADTAAHPRFDVRLEDMNARLDSTDDMSGTDVDTSGLHPTRSGYEKMASAWFDYLVENQAIHKCE